MVTARPAAWAAGVALAVATAAGAEGEFDRMVRQVTRAPEVTARVLVSRSDPFGGPPERTAGRLWYVPGRGLRYRSDEAGGEDIVIDRVAGSFLVYRSSERVVYRGAWERAPARLRRLIEDPEHLLERTHGATPERRAVAGALRSGHRLRRASLGDSLPQFSLWVAADPRSGLPRWLALASEEESLLVEFRGMTVRRTARPADLALGAPRGTPEQPLDPRELLRGGESR